MQKIVPSLWFDKECEEAINFYIEVFNGAPDSPKDSKIISLTRYPEDQQVGPMPDMAGKVLTVIFELAGQRFMALDGGPLFKFNESVSLYVECKDQAEVDYFWGKLSAVSDSEQCGWLKDKYGLAWQITPDVLLEFLTDPDEKRKDRVMSAMMTMTKIEIEPLLEAAKG